MVGGNNLYPFKLIEPSTEGRNLGVGLEKSLSSKGSQSTDNLRLDGIDLFEEERIAAFDLIRFGISVLGWAAFDDVGDVNLLPLEMDGLNNLG